MIYYFNDLLAGYYIELSYYQFKNLKINEINTIEYFYATYPLNQGIYYFIDDFIFIHYSLDFQMFYIVNSQISSQEVIQNEISKIQHFNILLDREYQLLFYSLIQGLEIFSINYDNLGLKYENDI